MTPQESGNWNPTHLGGSIDVLPFYSDMQSCIPRGGSFLEVGSFLGRSIAFMGALRPDVNLSVCDPWEDSFDPTLVLDAATAFCKEHGGLYNAFQFSMMKHAPEVLERLTIVRDRSNPGLKQFGDASMDFVFIDGSHYYDAVLYDCKEAIRIVKKGGVIGGHDFCWGNDVVRAVTEVFGSDFRQASWPSPREGWTQGHSSVWWTVR